MPTIDSATQPFLKFDMPIGAFPKFDILYGHLSNMQQGHLLKFTGDIGIKIISDIRQGYFLSVTGDRFS